MTCVRLWVCELNIGWMKNKNLGKWIFCLRKITFLMTHPVSRVIVSHRILHIWMFISACLDTFKTPPNACYRYRAFQNNCFFLNIWYKKRDKGIGSTKFISNENLDCFSKIINIIRKKLFKTNIQKSISSFLIVIIYQSLTSLSDTEKCIKY